MADKLSAVSTFPDAIHVHDGRSGRTITSIPLGQTVQDLFGHPYCVVHRGDLQKILLDACNASSSIDVHYEFEVENIHTEADSVSLSTKSGINSTKGKTAVLADGIWSNARKNHLALPAPEYSGKVAWRALVPIQKTVNRELMQESHLWLAPNSHAVTYPVRRGQALNVIVISHANLPEPGFSQSEGLAPAAQTLSAYGGPLTDILKLADDWSYWPIFESPYPIQMTGERVAMIGDAAHAMLPFAAQGAAMAIEDALVLSNCLAAGAVQQGIERFAKLRTGRNQRVSNLARTNGRIYHMDWPLSAARNTVMRFAPAKQLLKRQAWVYGWTPDSQ